MVLMLHRGFSCYEERFKYCFFIFYSEKRKGGLKEMCREMEISLGDVLDLFVELLNKSEVTIDNDKIVIRMRDEVFEITKINGKWVWSGYGGY